MADWFKIHNDMLDSKGMQFAMCEQPLVTSVWLVILSEASKNRSCRFSWSDADFELIGFARKINCSVPVFNQSIALLERIGYIKRIDGFIEIAGWDSKQSDYAKGKNKGYYKKTSEKLASIYGETTEKLASVSEVSTARGEEKRGEENNITHTHTSADANLPTWEDVKAEAAIRAVPESSAKTFFDHHEGNQLWTNQHGKLINWKHKLISWSANDRQPKPNYANRTTHRPTAPDRNSGTYNAAPLSDAAKAKVR